ncbi:MAG TPA: ABC transporter ATP-binding protein [Dehalococcoidia bacterium]|nr:ABC transporter ATP-binding protein [Dehalococcoidia bacterium]
MAHSLTPAPRLQARHVVARRGGRTILDVDALTVAPGEVLAVIGPNGAGKTTLLLHLALLERPTSGEVLFDGEPTRGRELRLRRRMALAFQEALLLDRSVRSNVELATRLRGVGRGERRERAERWLRRFGVGGLAERSPRLLSGGEAQRVSLARAFAMEPEVLLLDEPFRALDAPTRAALADDLSQVLGETGVTAVIVTHDHDEAARFGDRVAVLIGGRVRQVGTPADVFGAPADEEVAAFVGIETIVPVRALERGGGTVVLAAGPHTLEVVDERPFTEALLCLRPEDVSLSTAGEHVSGSARNRVAGRVTRIVRTGADARVELDCGFRLVARITRRSLEELGLEEGSQAVASFKATAAHVIVRG